MSKSRDDVAWIVAGEKNDFPLLIWQHTCLTINFVDGSSSMYRNGQLVRDKKIEEFIKLAENSPGAMVTNITWGSWDCDWSCKGTVSTSGMFTDLQIFGRILSKQELEDWTGCQERLTGDLVSWDTEIWSLNTTRNNSEVEHLDFETKVCDMRNISHHFFPTKLTFSQALDFCARVAGKLNV